MKDREDWCSAVHNTFVLDSSYSEPPIILSSFLLAEEHQFPPRLPLAPHSQCISEVGYGWLKPSSSVQLPGHSDRNKFYHIRCRTCFLGSSWEEAPLSEILKVRVRAGATATVLLLYGTGLEFGHPVCSCRR